MSEGVRAKGSETYGSVRLGEKREASEKENRPITCLLYTSRCV